MVAERAAGDMGDQKPAISIKKYANRRLYHTGTSTYVTLEDLAAMIQRGEDFVVQDAKSGEDITRAVLTQIIVEQEAKGTNLLPITFLRQLIRFYGDSLQSVVPSYLEQAMQRFAADQESLRERFASSFGKAGFPLMEDQVRKNMSMFQDAMKLFTPFALPQTEDAAAPRKPETASSDLDDLKRQVEEMQKKLAAIGRK